MRPRSGSTFSRTEHKTIFPASGEVAILAEARWTPPKQALPPLPTFLVFDAQPEARFRTPAKVNEGTGFIALNAGARGLMDISRAKERTRVFFLFTAT